MTDSVYIPDYRTGWWGGPDTRPRCRTTGKVAFPTVERAALSAKSIREREALTNPRKDGKVMNEFLCKFCGQWHVGHGKPKAPIQRTS